MTVEVESPAKTEDSYTCERCGDSYEWYIVAVPKEFPDMVEYFRSEYEDLCKPCRAYLHPEQAFAGDVTPKVEVDNE